MQSKIVASAFVAAAIIDGSSAFTSSQNRARVGTITLNAEAGRRELLGNFAKALGAAGAIAVGADKADGNNAELLAGLTNPAQESWRGKVSLLIIQVLCFVPLHSH